MKMLAKLSLVLTFVVLCDARTSEKLKVQLPDGSKLVGRYLTSDSGRGIRAWMGVPYGWLQHEFFEKITKKLFDFS